MKKIVAIICMAIVLVTGLTACSHGNLDGYYLMTSMEMDGAEQSDIANYQNVGLLTYLSFKTNGSVYLYTYGEEANGTYTETAMKFGSKETPYTVNDDGKIVVTDGSIVMTFTKSSKQDIEDILSRKGAEPTEAAQSSAAESSSTDESVPR